MEILSSGGQSGTAAEVVDARHLGFLFEGRGEHGWLGFNEFAQGALPGEQQRRSQIKAE